MSNAESKIVQIDGIPTECNPVLCGTADCDTAVDEGADPGKLISVNNVVDADEALINAMGRRWVLRVAIGDPEARDDDELWETIGQPWCALYSAAYNARAAALVAEAA